MRLSLSLLLVALLTFACDKKPIVKTVSPPQPLKITNEFVYLISLEGFCTSDEIKAIHQFDPSIQYLLASGHAGQRESDKRVNYASAKEFVDIAEKSFVIIQKIRIGGTFMTDSIVFDVVEDPKHNHYVTYARDRWF